MSSAEPRHWYGFFLSLLTAFMWGVLPIALELLLNKLDVVTITWARFAFSTVFVFVVLQRGGSLPRVRRLRVRSLVLIVVAILALLGNFLLYLTGLDLLNPETAQILIQLAPFLLMAGSVLFYQERMGPVDIIGALVLFAGLLLFFNERLGLLFQSFSAYTLGVVSMLLAALSWSVYGLLQKTLLRDMNSLQLTLLIYLGGSVVLLFPSTPMNIFNLGALQAMVLLFCCLNMVVGYGAFTEAIQVWQAAKVSAVIALAPVVTIVCMQLAVSLWPDYFHATGLNTWSYIGAALVVAGSMLSALAKEQPTEAVDRS